MGRKLSRSASPRSQVYLRVSDQFFTNTSEALYTHFKIDHSTLQIETGHPKYLCHLEPEGHV
jgi:hypothetical protein